MADSPCSCGLRSSLHGGGGGAERWCAVLCVLAVVGRVGACAGELVAWPQCNEKNGSPRRAAAGLCEQPPPTASQFGSCVLGSKMKPAGIGHHIRDRRWYVVVDPTLLICLAGGRLVRNAVAVAVAFRLLLPGFRQQLARCEGHKHLQCLPPILGPVVTCIASPISICALPTQPLPAHNGANLALEHAWQHGAPAAQSSWLHDGLAGPISSSCRGPIPLHSCPSSSARRRMTNSDQITRP